MPRQACCFSNAVRAGRDRNHNLDGAQRHNDQAELEDGTEKSAVTPGPPAPALRVSGRDVAGNK
jgi:hypothetical protein